MNRHPADGPRQRRTYRTEVSTNAQSRLHHFLAIRKRLSMKTGLLIAEHDEELREMFDHFATHSGFDVATASDGLECWTRIQSRAPEVLVVDAQIRWGGGEGVLARLREDNDGCASPVVFVTGDDSPETLSQRFGIDLRNCFQKPFRLSALLDSIRAAIPSRKPASPAVAGTGGVVGICTRN